MNKTITAEQLADVARQVAQYGFATCPFCTWIVSATKAGKLYRHGNKVTGVGAKATCQGSGLKAVA